MNNRDIAEYQARTFRSDNKLSNTEAIDLKGLLLKNDILTAFRPMSEKIHGLSLKAGENRFVLINSNNPKGRQHFTIAHELYHLYFDPNPEPHLCETDGAHKSEKAADTFAAEFLMPRDGIADMLSSCHGKGLTMGVILKLEQYYRVSHRAMVLRLKKLGYISEKQLVALSNIPIASEAGLYGYDASLYEKGNGGCVIGGYGELAKRLFDEERISEGHYWELLSLIIDGKEGGIKQK